MNCFILARDEGEFKKYKAGSLESDSFLDIYDNKNNKKPIASIIFRVLTSGKGQVCPMFVVLDIGHKKNDCKNHMDASKSKALLSLLVDIYVQTQEELAKGRIRNKVQSKIADILNEGIKDIVIPLSVVKIKGKELTIPSSIQKQIYEDTVLFIHWGGGAPKTYEDNFANLLKEYTENKGAQFTAIRAYAFSSRRAELFDVTKPKIDFPKTIEEVKILESKFKAAQKTSDARKIMTEYVLAVQNKIDNASQQFDVFCDAVKEVVAKIAKEWESGYLEEDEQAQRAKLVVHYNQVSNSPNNDTTVDTELANLFTTILSEEAKNG